MIGILCQVQNCLLRYKNSKMEMIRKTSIYKSCACIILYALYLGNECIMMNFFYSIFSRVIKFPWISCIRCETSIISRCTIFRHLANTSNGDGSCIRNDERRNDGSMEKITRAIIISPSTTSININVTIFKKRNGIRWI